MKVERASSVCSEDAPSSPDSIMSTGESASLESPQPSPGPVTDPFDDQRIYSPAYTAPSPAYSISSTGSGSSEAGSTGDDASPASSPGYERSSSPDFGFEFPPDSGYPRVEQFGCQAEFQAAVQEGDPRELKRILTRYSQLVQINGFTADGQTALTQSCLDGNLEVVKMLVAHGASLHLTNRDGFSPLHLACWRGKYDVMQYLLRYASSRR
ncbi:Notch-regulated ankyrin repeat-containing protein [Chionoecetes opilio]|uniref:Notch-regulated ankyrin repeat-containing protein n=1 Tax=Chionoecetes opilio TaxID=41210 RepID=A0A8J5BV03_CHIOP|nr:Notch-regulated ankyrin repeat-containing protein [Chionoecetes opilio]